jgi:hypothetical protein
MNLQFYREIHEKEFRRKDTLAQRASTIIAGLTTLWGLCAFVVVNYKPANNSIDILFWFLAGTSMITLGTAAYFLIRSYRVPALQDIARPIEWVNFWQELVHKYKNRQGTFESAEQEFTDHLIRLYAEVAGENIDVNDRRGTRLVRSNNALLAAFALLILTSLTYYYSNVLLREDRATQGGYAMFTTKDALLCVPAARVLESSPGPGKRPVPDPAPQPTPR